MLKSFLGFFNRVNCNTGKATIIFDPKTHENFQSIFREYETEAYFLAELARKSCVWSLKSQRDDNIRT